MTDLADGESVEMQGSAAKPYLLQNIGGVYSCTCPAWRNQSVPIEKRTCKHLRKLRGEQAEKDRIGGDLPPRAAKADKDKAGPPLLLAQTWDTATDVTDWWMSEKLDGVRAWWDGRQFLSRGGNQYHAPDWFVAGLPDTPLDGELWLDRGKFQRTISIVRRQDKSDHWKQIRYRVFDAPGQRGPFEDRWEYLVDWARSKAKHLAFTELHPQTRCRGPDHLSEELARVESLGGEGLMLRQPGSTYAVGRSFTLLKIKCFFDAEAVVLAHQGGKGKHKGKLGALLVQLPDGTEFSVGTGFSDAQRAAPPPIGSTITFRYQELSDGGVPRFPSFLRAHDAGSKSEVAGKQTRGGGAGQKPKAESRKPGQAGAAASIGPVSKAKDPAAKSSQGTSGVRYFEFIDGKSEKFWEIATAGTEVTVRYGRIGAAGTTKVKDFANAAAADAHATRLIDEKTAKGYVERPAAS